MARLSGQRSANCAGGGLPKRQESDAETVGAPGTPAVTRIGLRNGSTASASPRSHRFPSTARFHSGFRNAMPALPCPAFEPARPAVTAPATHQTDAEPAPKGTRPLSPTMMTMQQRVQQPSPVTRSGKPFDETEAPLAPRFLLVSALPRRRHWRNRLGGNAPERLPQRGVSSARAVSRARQRKRFSTSVLCSGLAYQSGSLPFATRWGMGDAGRY